MPFFSFGNSPISWPLRGCIARTMSAQATWSFLSARKEAVGWPGKAYCHLLALVPLTVVPMLLTHDRLLYVAGVFMLSSGFLFYGARLALRRSNTEARRLLFVSIIYLPLVLLLMMLAKS